jgi:uncharacterized protein with GYD domain
MLLKTKDGMSHHVVHDSLKIEGVKISHSVVGNYDVILYAEGKDIDDLRRIRLAVEQINGLTVTETVIHA